MSYDIRRVCVETEALRVVQSVFKLKRTKRRANRIVLLARKRNDLRIERQQPPDEPTSVGV